MTRWRRRRRKMKSDVPIPTSAATRNFKLSLWSLVVVCIMVLFNAPDWIFIPMIGISGGFFLSMVMCILDVQEFKMKQNQKIIELLSRIVNKDNNDN